MRKTVFLGLEWSHSHVPTASPLLSLPSVQPEWQDPQQGRSRLSLLFSLPIRPQAQVPAQTYKPGVDSLGQLCPPAWGPPSGADALRLSLTVPGGVFSLNKGPCCEGGLVLTNMDGAGYSDVH